MPVRMARIGTGTGLSVDLLRLSGWAYHTVAVKYRIARKGVRFTAPGEVRLVTSGGCTPRLPATRFTAHVDGPKVDASQRRGCDREDMHDERWHNIEHNRPSSIVGGTERDRGVIEVVDHPAVWFRALADTVEQLKQLDPLAVFQSIELTACLRRENVVMTEAVRHAGGAPLSGGWWLLSARRWFHGPRVQGTPEELAAIERELASIGN